MNEERDTNLNAGGSIDSLKFEELVRILESITPVLPESDRVKRIKQRIAFLIESNKKNSTELTSKNDEFIR